MATWITFDGEVTEDGIVVEFMEQTWGPVLRELAKR